MRHSFKVIAIAAGLATGNVVQAQGAVIAPERPDLLTEQPGVQAVDRDFLRSAAESGHAEIEAGRMVLGRQVGPQVRQFAQQLVDDHLSAGEQLRSIAARKGVRLPGDPSLGQRGLLQIMRAKDGEDFVSQFVTDFGIDAHNNTIALFRDEVRRGRDVEVRQFAQRTLPTLQGHLRQAQQLQDSLSARSGTGASTVATSGSDGLSAARADSDAAHEAQEQIDEAVQVVQRMKGDPRVTATLERARGVFILPDYGRGAFGIGVQGGQGVLVTRRDGDFSNPVFYNLAGISVGAQAGGVGGAIAMLLMTDRAVQEFASSKKFSLNADAGLTIVDFSRREQVSGGKVQDIVLWSSTKGAYAGMSVGLTDVYFDAEDNRAYYGRHDLNPRQILDGTIKTGRNNVLGMVLGA